MKKVLTSLEKTTKDMDRNLRNMNRYTKELQKFYLEEFKKFQRQYGLNIDPELLKEFFKKPYKIRSTNKPNEWEVIVPRFVDFQVGWLDHSDESFNVFLINKYTRWLGELPEEIQKELKMPEPQKIMVSGDNVIFEKGQEKEIDRKFGNKLSVISKGTGKIKQGKEFDLIADIIDSGTLPFIPKPVDVKDMRDPKLNFDFSGKYKFQEKAYSSFLKYGALGVYWMTGAGKSFLAMMIFDTIKGNKKLLVVPTLTLKEQWKEYFEKYAPRLLKEVRIITYQSYEKIKDEEWDVIGFDECHFLPANTFSRLATLRTKYRFGLSATPYREDGRTNYIFALTGYPVGLSWKNLMDILGKEYHDLYVYVVRDMNAKYLMVKSLVDFDKKTAIYVFRIDVGEKISKMLGVPFVHGKVPARERMKIVRNSKVFVISKVGELGLSLKDLQHEIELDFLGGRTESIQRTGRMFHSEVAEKHDIIMTADEFPIHSKKLHAFVEKGFHPILRPMVDGTFDIVKEVKKREIRKPGTVLKTTLSIVDELYEEGYFVEERYFKDIKEEIKRRGGKVRGNERSSIFSKLNSFVKKKLLYRVKKNKGFVFIQR